MRSFWISFFAYLLAVFIYDLLFKKRILVKIKLIEGGRLPLYKRNGDVCMDCYARELVVIQKGQRRLVALGFAMQLPVGYEAVVRPRSGLTNSCVDVAIGTIDSNYRGEVMANVLNNSDSPITIFQGDRICQIAVREAPQVKWRLVSELSDTERSDKGFGSTGLK